MTILHTLFMAIASKLALGYRPSLPKKHKSQVQVSANTNKTSLLKAQLKRERKNALRLLHSVE